MAYRYDKLCKLDSGGFNHASLSETIEALANRMKELYGNDIDISQASADGQYIEGEAYILENIFAVLDNMYTNLNPNSASGRYLDILANLSSVFRKRETYSTVQLYVYNNALTTQKAFDISNNIVVEDNLGNTWTSNLSINDGTNPEFNSNNNYTVVLKFQCDENGEIPAYGTGTTVNDIEKVFDRNENYYYNADGKIGSFKPISTNFLIYQTNDATIGTLAETDSSLRNRLLYEKGLNALTTIDSLQSNLYDLEFIKDVKIFNAPVDRQVTYMDTNSGESTHTIEAHQILVLIRLIENIDSIASNLPYKDNIGRIVYNNLTPGIATDSIADNEYGETLEYDTPDGIAIKFVACLPIEPHITIDFFANGEVSEANQESIKRYIINYVESIKIDTKLNYVKLMNNVMLGDLKNADGTSVVFPTGCTGDDTAGNEYKNYLTYYKINAINFDLTNNKIEINGGATGSGDVNASE